MLENEAMSNCGTRCIVSTSSGRGKGEAAPCQSSPSLGDHTFSVWSMNLCSTLNFCSSRKCQEGRRHQSLHEAEAKQQPQNESLPQVPLSPKPKGARLNQKRRQRRQNHSHYLWDTSTCRIYKRYVAVRSLLIKRLLTWFYCTTRPRELLRKCPLLSREPHNGL